MRLRWAVGPVAALTVARLDGRAVVVTSQVPHPAATCRFATVHDCRAAAIRLWDVETGAPRGVWPGIAAQHLAASGGVLVGVDPDGRVAAWDLADGTPRSLAGAAAPAEPVGDLYAGGGLAVSADRSGRVVRWDLAAGRELGPLDARAGSVDGGTVDGVPLLVTGGAEVVVWAAATGQRLATPAAGDPVDTVRLTTVDGRPAVVAVGRDDRVRVLDLWTGAPVVAPFPGGAGIRVGNRWRRSLAALDDALYIAGEYQVVRWDLRTGVPAGEPLRGRTRQALLQPVRGLLTAADDVLTAWDVTAGAAAPGPGGAYTHAGVLDDLAVAADSAGTLTARRLADGRPVGSPVEVGRVRHLAGASLAGRPVVVTGAGTPSDPDGWLHRWDPLAGHELEPAVKAHPTMFTALATSIVDGVPVVLTGGRAGAVRLYELETAALRISQAREGTDLVTGIATGDGIALVSWYASPLSAWDLRTGALSPVPHADRYAGEPVVALVPIGARTGVVTLVRRGAPVHRPTGLRVRDLDTGEPIGPSLGDAEGPEITAVAVARIDGRPVLAVARIDATVQVIDPSAGAPVGPGLTLDDPVVALAAVGDGRLLLARDYALAVVRIGR